MPTGGDYFKIGGMVLLAIIVFTWPTLQIQLRTDQNSNFPNEIKTVNDKFQIMGTVWNRGGLVTGKSIIIPNTCFSLLLSENISCKHQGYSGAVPCAAGVCDYVEPGKLLPEQTFYFELQKPVNFSMEVLATGFLGELEIIKSTKKFYCDAAHRSDIPSEYKISCLESTGAI